MKAASLLASLAMSCCCLAHAQGTVPTFTRVVGGETYTFAGQDPAQDGTTLIPTVLVPIKLTFAGKTTTMDATQDVTPILKSPLFSTYRFAAGEETQYGDALLRATFQGKRLGHTLLGTPQVKVITINIPAGEGYLLHSKRSGQSFAVVDSEYVEKELFRQLPKRDGQLLIAVAHNTTFYAAGDATVCCTWGTHGVDPATGSSFVLGSYLHDAPAIVTDQDIQPLTEQLAEFFYVPSHNPYSYFHTKNATGNYFVTWLRPGRDGACGGSGIGTNYFLLEPTDVNLKNNFPASKPYIARAAGFDYHLQNVALLNWYVRADRDAGVYSFP
ncbi:MAG TPA: hypothetical protein VFE77_08040, partial [Rhodanobacter sp.]|nr:hypothetical protein [Rhodanobacter sp.]